MANQIVPKKSVVANKVPTTLDLRLGEVSINHADKIIYARHPNGPVQQIAASPQHTHTLADISDLGDLEYVVDNVVSPSETYNLKVTDSGDITVSNAAGTLTTTLEINSTEPRVIALPNKNGVLAITEDIVKADWNAESGAGQILNKPALNFATTEQGAKADTASQPGHGHSISDVQGLQAALDSVVPVAPSDTYSEPTYSNGVLAAITTWNSSIKAVLVQTKSFTYTAGKLTQIIVKDGNNATILTKTISYTGDTLANITEDYA
jgi:hypothetical protein